MDHTAITYAPSTRYSLIQDTYTCIYLPRHLAGLSLEVSFIESSRLVTSVYIHRYVAHPDSAAPPVNLDCCRVATSSPAIRTMQRRILVNNGMVEQSHQRGQFNASRACIYYVPRCDVIICFTRTLQLVQALSSKPSHPGSSAETYADQVRQTHAEAGIVTTYYMYYTPHFHNSTHYAESTHQSQCRFILSVQ